MTENQKMVARGKILIPSGWHSVNIFYDFHDISRLHTPRLAHGEEKGNSGTFVIFFGHVYITLSSGHKNKRMKILKLCSSTCIEYSTGSKRLTNAIFFFSNSKKVFKWYQDLG